VFDLTGRVAVVTGGSRGIGRGAALALAGRGAQVFLSYIRGKEEAQATVSAIEAAGGQAQADQLEVGDFEGAELFINRVTDRTGRLDILVANAGVSVDSLLLRLKESDWDQTLNVNLKGAIACARAAIRPMLKAKFGRIIFLSSVVAEMGNAGQAAYCASKAGLLGAAKALAREYATRQITVNSVAPGYIETDMTRNLAPEARKTMLGAVPLGRIGSIEDVAAAVVYLASTEASYVTGQTLRVNGGMYM
jgi:3-oxoacyl-[acyl-carrier protein] reductase